MSDEQFFYSKSGFVPYSDASGFKVNVTIEQATEDSEPTISIDDVWRVPASQWVDAARRIERMLELIHRPS